MAELHPTVRYLILCDDVQTDPENPLRVNLFGLMSAIHSVEQPPYPLLVREFCAFIQLTECRGIADMRIEIQHADSGEVLVRTRTRTVSLPSDPLEVIGVNFRIQDCLFAEPGLYWVQLWYNSEVIAQQPLILR
jgi:Family of unknown function (DUF6941)